MCQPRLRPILIVIIFAALRSAEALKVNATLDPCVDSSDCRLGLICQSRGGAICVGFSDEGLCRCLPPEIRECSSSEVECPIAEGCAESKASGGVLCVSCNRINEPDSNYTLVKGRTDCQITPTPLPTPTKSPGPLRRRLDLCSDVDACEMPLTCECEDGAAIDTTTGPCFCTSKNQSGCKTTDDCSHPKETCVRSTTDNSTACASCTMLKYDPSYVPEMDDGKCDDVPLTSDPIYLPPNGLGGDICRFDNQCKLPYRCLKANSKLCAGSADCRCALKKGLQKCDALSDCLDGEVCALKRLETSATCVSLSEYLVFAAGSYQLVGRLPNPGKLATFDPCQWNPDCQEGLYCTHLSELTVGRCYGRRGCSCLPARSVHQCSSEKDCRTGEKCAKIPGARQEPTCYSEDVLPSDPFFVDIASNSSTPAVSLPSDGWISSSCRNDSDCAQEKFPRVCQHYSEDVPINMSGIDDLCGGRQMCVCKSKKESNAKCKSSTDCGSGELCVIISDSAKDVPGTCESSQVMGLDYFAEAFSLLTKKGQRSLPSPSLSPSASPSESSFSSSSPSISVTPSSEPSPTQSMSVSNSVSATVSASASTSASPSRSAMVTVSISPTAIHNTSSASPSDEDGDVEQSPDAVCVDAAALKHIHVSELVYAKHRRASVLCDEQGSCATPGHIVEWRGEAMMMRSYCQHYGLCIQSVRLVNSPRMRMRVRVASNTKGLYFTPLAASLATRVEERILRSLVRFGF